MCITALFLCLRMVAGYWGWAARGGAYVYYIFSIEKYMSLSETEIRTHTLLYSAFRDANTQQSLFASGIAGLTDGRFRLTPGGNHEQLFETGSQGQRRAAFRQIGAQHPAVAEAESG